MSGNSALFPKAPYAAVGAINAAIVALAKAFSDRGIADGIQVNSVLPGPVMTGRRLRRNSCPAVRRYMKMKGSPDTSALT